jgi:hypothetical protein
MVENSPPEIGPMLESPIKPRMDGKKAIRRLTAGMKINVKFIFCKHCLIA